MDKYACVDPVDPQDQTAFAVARAGYPIIFASAFITAVFALLDFTVITLIFVAVTFFICYFFRDPCRVASNKKGALVAPADGKIVAAQIVEKNRFIEGQCLKISIFMSVFNVHVNRIPCKGTVTRISYHPGKFISANFDKASSLNEHNAVFLESEKGQQICFVQIAGLIARRIICTLQEGDRVNCGQRFGMICFGSRVDIYLPADTKLLVAVGDKVTAGTTILGNWL